MGSAGGVPFVSAVDVDLSDPRALRVSICRGKVLKCVCVPKVGRGTCFSGSNFIIRASSSAIPNIPYVSNVDYSGMILCRGLPVGRAVLGSVLRLARKLGERSLIPSSISCNTRGTPMTGCNGIDIVVNSAAGLAHGVRELGTVVPSLRKRSNALRLRD